MTEKYISQGLLILFFMILSGCGTNTSSNTFGTPILNREIIPMIDIFDQPNNYSGKTVTLKGVIDLQDENGRWFYLNDKDARMYVELHESGFSIPDLVNKLVIVEGKIEVKMGIPSLIAAGVECQ